MKSHIQRTYTQAECDVLESQAVRKQMDIVRKLGYKYRSCKISTAKSTT